MTRRPREKSRARGLGKKDMQNDVLISRVLRMPMALPVPHIPIKLEKPTQQTTANPNGPTVTSNFRWSFDFHSSASTGSPTCALSVVCSTEAMWKHPTIEPVGVERSHPLMYSNT